MKFAVFTLQGHDQLLEVLNCQCSGEEKTESGWQAVIIKKRVVVQQGLLGVLGPFSPSGALQEKAALLAVKEALQSIPEPHHTLPRMLQTH